ncbi:MAG: metallophosphoesterase family protein [Polyangiales bacterium]
MSLPPVARPIAFLSDVHGNLEALEAVLTALPAHDVGLVVVAGDLLLGGVQPLEVWRRLQGPEILLVRGLSDTALVSVDDAALEGAGPSEAAERFRQTRAGLGDLVMEQLRRLPLSRRIPLVDGSEVVVVHGSPLDPTVAIDLGVDDEELAHLLDDDPADFVVCGAAHVPFLRRVDQTVVVGLGSVGEAPEGRVAHFAILRPRMDGPEVALEHVTY